MQIERLHDRFRKFGREDVAEELEKIIENHPDLPPSLPKVIYSPVETLEEAKRTLGQFPPLRHAEDTWHWRTRQEEIAEYGDQSVLHLVPVTTQLHAKVVGIFAQKEIHTKQDLVNIPPSDIPNLSTARNFGETPIAKAISAMHFLAREELAQQNVESGIGKKVLRSFWRKR